MTSEQRKRLEAARAAHRQNRENLVVATEHSAAVVPLVVAIPASINQLAFAIEGWAPGTMAHPITYTKDQDVRMYSGTPRKCTQTHTHHGEPNWDPDHYAAGWMEYHGTSIDTARPWIKPGHAEDRYRFDEYMIWTDGTIQRCIAPDGTVYSPTEYPAHWARAQGESVTDEPTEPTDPEPINEWPEWVAGTYAKGAQVTRNGKHYISQVDGNHWEPGAAGVYDNIWKLIA